MKTVLGGGFLLVSLAIAWGIYQFTVPSPIPRVEDEYWGPSRDKDKPEDKSIVPFQINVSNTILANLRADLEKELRSNRFVEPLETVGFEYGFNTRYLQKVGEYWLQKYDWRAREKRLNKYPQFTTQIGGLTIHFYHVKPPKDRQCLRRPVLLAHGWPSTVVEYYKVIELLTEPKNSEYCYEVVVPSLPGYGFSSAAKRRGFQTVQMANIFKRLMDRLGYQKFFTLGGDWGGMITQDLATLYPSSVSGGIAQNCIDFSGLSIVKQILVSYFPSLLTTPDVAPHVRPWGEFVSYAVRESGYVLLQATKPDTVGAALTHSPLGLAAYILEKFSTWTNRAWISREDGGLEEKFSLDDLLDNVMLFWVTGSITTSQRLYSEFLNPHKSVNLDNVPTNVPFNCFYLPEDIFVMTKFSLSNKFSNLQRLSVARAGGHFAGLEESQMVADEALSFFNSLP